jgi:hypothetical protein
MEFSALLAGEPQSDRPESVHPLLAAVARVVNDAVGDAARQELAGRARTLVGTATDDPGIVDDVLELVLGRAQTVALPIWAPHLRRAGAQLRRRAGRPARPDTRRRIRSAERTVTLAVAGLAFAPLRDRDEVLVQLLDEVVQLVRSRARPAPDTAESHGPPAGAVPR